jgi:hypothetical protein
MSEICSDLRPSASRRVTGHGGCFRKSGEVSLLESLAAPQGFEPRYADPEASGLPFSGVPWRALESRESPFAVVGYRHRGMPDNTRRHATPTAENGSISISKLPALLPYFFEPRYADFWSAVLGIKIRHWLLQINDRPDMLCANQRICSGAAKERQLLTMRNIQTGNIMW